MSEVLEEREKTHGDFSEVARIACATKAVWFTGSNWNNLNPGQRESLSMIASKVARILSGNNNCKDHWVDVGGYAELIARDL